MPGLRRPAAQGLLPRRHRLQGQRLLQDRQPLVRQEVVDDDGDVVRQRLVGVDDVDDQERDEERLVLLVVVDLLDAAVLVVLVEQRRRLLTRPDDVLLGVFGGSGFYEFLDDVVEVPVHTPYGAPSAAVAVGTVEGRRVAFLPRHGRHHELPPHRVNFRANVWAMREVGVQRLFGPCAAGSLTPAIRPGEFVVLDQLVDRTNGRSADTYFDGGVVGHISFADPYCPELRALASAAGRSVGVKVHDEGTVVVVPGPRFSTRAESTWFRRQGGHTINMTQYPEAYLARELGICYSGIALVTDFDTGVEDDPGVAAVTMDDVFAVLRANVAATRSLLFEALPKVPLERTSCGCATALDQGPLRA